MTVRIIQKRTIERGATALVVVLFSILLISTITVGFLRLIIQDQKRTTNDELSRGAYDAALAGVEDGKRVLQALANGSAPVQAAIKAAIDRGDCNTVHAAKILSPSDSSARTDEVLITAGGSSDDSSTSFDQAYTCVKISTTTPTYQNSLDTDKSDVIPLATAGSFTNLTIAWHSPSAGDGTPGHLTNTPASLPAFNQWSGSGPASTVRPALMRLQLIQFNRNRVSADDLDSAAGSATLFLYPSSISGIGSQNFAIDGRTGGVSVARVSCSTVIAGYACRATIAVPNPPNGTPADRQAYLRVTPLYAAKTSFEVSLDNGAQFDAVEPSIDSTGRASNVFRRVNARVRQTSTSFDYPRATVDITNNLCKSFGITSTEYRSDSRCLITPN